MKRLAVAGGVLALAVVSFVGSAWDPPRARGPGWRAPWDALPLETEERWAPDRQRRFLVQALFAGAVDELTECTEEYFHERDSKLVQLELLIEVGKGGAQLTWVVPESRPELEAGLLPCLTRALEKTKPVPAPGVAVGTRWRLGLSFVLNPVDALVSPPWWQRFVPDDWRSGGGSAIHVG
ncbi:MAG: hypothetical protein ACOZQL_18000 [Myxococcota bacterium]